MSYAEKEAPDLEVGGGINFPPQPSIGVPGGLSLNVLCVVEEEGFQLKNLRAASSVE